ncbi:hypothetical protein BRADI_3g10934v3 [Brachypodium distachyon]|uniref:Uncharacterized protein n=1 Tax=Brachypodium distachyon TaxID=15368 RepID=A0A2K2CWI3_BRADI|nr:hypothetical protein BRADI_3g10934v3 [Brachypodium distachyon]
MRSQPLILFPFLFLCQSIGLVIAGARCPTAGASPSLPRAAPAAAPCPAATRCSASPASPAAARHQPHRRAQTPPSHTDPAAALPCCHEPPPGASPPRTDAATVRRAAPAAPEPRRGALLPPQQLLCPRAAAAVCRREPSPPLPRAAVSQPQPRAVPVTDVPASSSCPVFTLRERCCSRADSWVAARGFATGI